VFTHAYSPERVVTANPSSSKKKGQPYKGAAPSPLLFEEEWVTPPFLFSLPRRRISPLRGGVDHSSFLIFSSKTKKRQPYRGAAPSSLLLRGGVDHSSFFLCMERGRHLPHPSLK
jgi:hypothetical protein